MSNYQRKELEVSVLKVFSSKGEEKSKYGKTELRLVVYNSKYCRLEKRLSGEFETEDGETKRYSKMKGLDLGDVETILANADHICTSMKQFEASKQDKLFKD